LSDSISEIEEWQQYYPTHSFKERDVLLKEYEMASNNVATQEKVFVNAANILFVLITILGSFLVAYFQYKPTLIELFSLKTLALILFAILFLSWLTIKYFSERQKSIAYDSRKIVVLRKMLGLDYGANQLVLPNQRLEGATNPFSIKMFPGWFTMTAYPFWIMILLTCSILTFLLPYFIISLNKYFVDELKLVIFQQNLSVFPLSYIIITILVILYAFSYRKNLYDSNESSMLIFSIILSKILSVKLTDSFEYILYRAKLAHYELLRLKYDVSALEKYLIRIEDRTFYKNRGISPRSIIRAIWEYIKRKKISGASTLTQQLVRSLFIIDYHKKIRRKILEIFLAFWANKKIAKRDILDIYIHAVRFEKGVIGIIPALSHFFPDLKSKVISNAQAFFLVERISNIRSSLLLDRLKILIKDMKEQKHLTIEDISELKLIYRTQVNSKRIIVNDNRSFEKWINE
jgi:penicillin-binding protein 1A